MIEINSWRSWLIWFIATFYGFFQFTLQGSVGLMVPELIGELSIDSTDIGFLTASYFVTYLILQVPAGMLVDRFGARRILLGAVLLCVSGCIMFALARSYPVAIAGRLIMGFGTSPAIISCFYLAANWFSPQRFAFVVGLTEALAMFGGAVGSETLAVYIHHFGWRFTMLSCAALAFGIFVFVWIYVRDFPKNIVPRERNCFRLVLHQFKSIITRKQIWLCGLFGGLIFALIAAFAGLWCVSYLMVRYDVTREMAAWGGAILFIGVGAASPLIGWVVRSVKMRRPVMFAGTIGAFLLLVIMLTVPTLSFPLILILLFFLGCCSSIYILSFAIVSELTSIEGRGCAMGFTNALCILFGAPILQPLIGWIVNNYGCVKLVNNLPVYSLQAYNIALWSLPCIVALGFVCLLFIRQNYCMARPNEV